MSDTFTVPDKMLLEPNINDRNWPKPRWIVSGIKAMSA